MSIKTFFHYKVMGFFQKKETSHKEMLHYLKQIKKPVILEAGAANGCDTLRFSKLAPNALIYAFEPVTKTFNLLQKTVRSRSNVKIFHMALADFDGVKEIFISKNDIEVSDIAASSSLLEPNELLYENYPYLSFNEKEEVEVKTIDSWAKSEGVDHIDAMWLDMQGYEFSTLKASPIIMKTVRVIYTEVNFIETYRGSGTYNAFRDWLLSLGFKIEKESIEGVQGNVLFVRS